MFGGRTAERVVFDEINKTVDTRHLGRLIKEYAVDEIYFEEPSLNGHQRR